MNHTLAAAAAAALAILGATGVGEAQLAGRTPRIGLLKPAFEYLGIPRVTGWLQGLGWIDP